MAKTYKTGLVITGDAKGGIKAVELTKDQLTKLNKTQRKSTEYAKEYATQITKNGRRLANYAGVAATAMAGIGAAMVRSNLQSIDTLAKTSDKLGIVTEELTRLRFAAEQTAGVSNKTLDMALQRMTRRLSEASRGMGEAKGAIKELGLSAEDLAKLTPDQQFKAIADAMQGVESQSDRVRLSFKLFDSEGVNLVNTLAVGSKGIEDLGKQADQAGISISRIDAAKIEAANDSMNRARQVAKGFGQQLTIQVAPILDSLADKMFNLSAEVDGVGNAAEKAFNLGVDVAGVFADGIHGIHVLAMAVKVGFTALATGFVNLIDTALSSAAYLASLIPGVNIDYESSTFASFNARLKKDLASSKDELHNLAMQELPSTSMKKFVKEVQAESTKAAKTVAKNNKKIVSNIVDLDKPLKDSVKSLVKEVDNFGGAWSRTGNVIADSFGSALDVMTDYSAKMEQLTSLQEKLGKERAKAKDGTKEAFELDKKMAKLNEESTTSQLSAIGSILGASSKMFKENSKERKALHALETGFMVAEMAMAAQKAVVNAVGAISNQGTSGDPYTAFARIAAMVGVMGGVLAAAGIAFSGGGGGGYTAPSAGTGTVLGSNETSESIVNSQEIFKDIALDQLAELQGIRMSMVSLASGIERLAITLTGNLDFNGGSYDGELGTIKSAADKSMVKFIDKISGPMGIGSKILGSFSSTKKKLIDSGLAFGSQSLGDVLASGELGASQYNVVETTKKKFWGMSKKKRIGRTTQDVDGEIEGQIGGIFNYISDSVVKSAELLGFGVETALNDTLSGYQIDIGDISLKDKDGDEIKKELEAVFSQQSDLIAEYLIPSIADYRKIGEGSFEALSRVTKTQVVFNDHLARTGNSLSSLSNVLQIEVGQSIVSLMGGIDEFTAAANDYYEAFYSEEEKFAQMTKSIAEAMGGLGYEVPELRDGFRNLVDGIELTTEAGQRQYAMLMQLAPSMDNYYKKLEDAKKQTEESTKEAAAVEVDWIGYRAQEIQTAYNEEMNLLQQLHNEKIAGLQEQHRIARDLMNTVSGLKLGDISALSATQKLDFARSEFAGMQVKIASGDLTGLDSIGSLAESYLGQLSSYAPNSDLYNTEFGSVIGYLENLGVSMGANEDSGQVIARLNESLLDEQKKLNQKAERELNYLARMATDDSSVVTLLGNLPDALAKSLGSIIGHQMSNAGSLNDTVRDLYESKLGRDADKEGYAYWQSRFASGADQGQVAAEFNSASINELYTRGLGREADAEGAAYWQGELDRGMSFADLKKTFFAAAAENGEKTINSFDVGSPFITHDQVANIHRGEMIIDPQSSAVLRKYGIQIDGGAQDSAAMLEELRALREEVAGLRAERSADAQDQIDATESVGRSIQSEIVTP